MSEKEYISRIFDGIIDFTLKSKGALVIVGPKWCGKSTTAKRYNVIPSHVLHFRKNVPWLRHIYRSKT